MRQSRPNNRQGNRRRGKPADRSLLADPLLDRGFALSDGTVISIQDRFEARGRSDKAPTVIPRCISNQSYWARMSVTPFTISSSTTVNSYNALSFALASFNQYSDYTAVFDQYCLVEVCVRIMPLLEATANTTLSTLITCIDHDDATVPPSLASVQGHSTCLETTNKGQTRLIRPRFAVSAYDGAFGAYANKTGYIDCASSAVQHYGLKYVLPPTGNVFTYQVMYEAVIHFRDNQ